MNTSKDYKKVESLMMMVQLRISVYYWDYYDDPI